MHIFKAEIHRTCILFLRYAYKKVSCKDQLSIAPQSSRISSVISEILQMTELRAKSHHATCCRRVTTNNGQQLQHLQHHFEATEEAAGCQPASVANCSPVFLDLTFAVLNWGWCANSSNIPKSRLDCT